MKILAIGDFHGEFSKKLIAELKKEKFDAVAALGDYTGLKEWRPYIMKRLKEAKAGKKSISGEEYFGKKAYHNLLKRDYVAGKNILIELNKLGKPVFVIFGNGDWYKSGFNDLGKNYEDTVKKLKNIKQINYGKIKFKDINFIGFGGYMDIDAYFEKNFKKSKGYKAYHERVKRRKHSREKLFRILKKIKGDKILLLHYPPKGAFDIIKDKKGNPMNGKSTGISIFNEAIKKYKPKLVLCGHMHEYQGIKKLQNIPIINPGEAARDRYAVISIDNNSKKIKVKFKK